MLHKLELYRLATQHPDADADLLARIYAHYRGELPWLLKEDFAGGAALACAWTLYHNERQALAVEMHAPTARWAQQRTRAELGPRAADLQVIRGDSAAITSPRVDVVAALNFSTFIYHQRSSMLAYLRAAKRSLRPGGILVLDIYGGPGALRPGLQKRRVTLPAEMGKAPAKSGKRAPLWFEYQWEQRSYDAVTGKVDCRIHFTLPGGKRLENAFRYDWRLWTIPELLELLAQAGFSNSALWCDHFDAATGRSDGAFTPQQHLPPREDFVALLVALK